MTWACILGFIILAVYLPAGGGVTRAVGLRALVNTGITSGILHMLNLRPGFGVGERPNSREIA